MIFTILAALLAVLLVVLALAAAVGGTRNSLPPRQFSTPVEPDVAPDDASASDLSLSDPVEALLRYGTPADADRLAGQGIDLSALGYRSPDAH